MPQRHYVLNEPAVASQLIDGETILIHFDRGRYYSSANLGSEVLQRLLEHQSPERLVELLVAQFALESSIATEAVAVFIDTLTGEGLLVPTAPPGASNGTPLDARFASSTFQPLVLEVHSEIEDLLRLDPLHDVDETGWPSVAADAG